MSDSAYLFDSNVWVALAFPSHPAHDRALEAYGETSEVQPAVFCRSTQQSFLRLVTTPALLQRYGTAGFTNKDALIVLEQFLSLPKIAYREEPASLVPHWRNLAARETASPKLWMDAYLAAFAIAADLELVTFDRDFAQFSGLKLKLLKVVSPE